jgi:hypothetical protein
MNPGTVYICHHIDTEGPLWETLPELFARLKITFNLDIEPSYQNLKKLQQREFSISDDLWKELKMVIDPHTVGFKKNWAEIDEMLDGIMSQPYRNGMLDSWGEGWLFNWHVMDHVGFGFENPRHRDYGYHNIFDYYKFKIESTRSSQDVIHWHFHPISFYKEAHIPATSYDNSMHTLHQVISRRLIDKNWFPCVNRAGFHTERIDANLFLEQWLPFDPSNQATTDDQMPAMQLDIINGRYGDWRGAPSDWSVYNPSFEDWRKPGSLKRTIARILNMKSRHRNISEQEIEKAFQKAANGEAVYLGITNHDWRDMKVEIDEFRAMLSNVIVKYPNVKFKFCETVKAFQQVLGYDTREIEGNKISLDVRLEGNSLQVKVLNGKLFGPQPYLAIKTKTREYFHDNFDFQSGNSAFSYALDGYTLPLSLIEKIGVGTNDKYGNQFIKVINV